MKINLDNIRETHNEIYERFKWNVGYKSKMKIRKSLY